MHPPRRYRGSPARLRRLKRAALTPPGIWLLFALTLTATFLMLAWLARYS